MAVTNEQFEAMQDAKNAVIDRQLDRIRFLMQALRDIAQAEPIPTPEGAFEWCVDAAKRALSDDPENYGKPTQ